MDVVAEMHKEWNREEMFNARNQAYLFVYDNFEIRLTALEKQTTCSSHTA